ncbi:protein REPRESSOR OF VERNALIZATION 1-like [Rutidosis leptorrhynchoides]|uniref:protein REPRESSOR OF VERNALIZATION 1-like n=1 Tax=Rutidosis leptorrhynchoides TaxID=125765 RepID=UPI003A9979A8
MRNRRYLATSDEDEEDVAPPEKLNLTQRRRKRMEFYDEDDEEEKQVEAIKQLTKPKRDNKKRNDDKKEDSPPPPVNEDEEVPVEDATPIGDVIRVSGKGKTRRNHYKSFEYDGLTYELEDSVLLVADTETPNKKPYVAIIKDVTETKDGNVMVNGQWFYRPEEAEKKNGGNWQSNDTRELFYSFHRDEVPAESVMHKCVVHFIPANKQIPSRKVHPGFIVRKVYDTTDKRLFNLTDKDYEDHMQHEIDILVQKTMSRIGELPDIKINEDTVNTEDQFKSKRLMRRKSMLSLDVTRDDDVSNKSGGPLSRSETPGSCNSIASEYYNILVKFDAVTRDHYRDKWLEKLLEAVQYVCNNVDGSQSVGKEDNNGTGLPMWPDDAVRAVTALELASQESLSSDHQKYNQKMRQLCFNLKKNAQLALRLLKGELEASKILSMSPIELKEGLTAEEIASKEPEEDTQVQMTDARCKRCTEKKVRLIEIISGGHGDRYQLECTACGNMWYASRDEASTLTIDGPSSKTVGTAPWATAKFEDVEKKLVSPRDNPLVNGSFKKATEPYVTVPERQKSFNKSTTEEHDNPPPPTDPVV